MADGAGPIADWFADPGYVTRATRRLVLYALVPPGVPDAAVEEALTTVAEIIGTPRTRGIGECKKDSRWGAEATREMSR